MEKAIKSGIAPIMYEVHGKEDLDLKPGLNINAPPSNGRCDCCGKSFDELKSFGGPGDPLVGDFSGALLIKKFRPTLPPDPEAEKFFGPCQTKEDHEQTMDLLIEKYGKEEAENLLLAHEGFSQIGASWECRDCAVLDHQEYFNILEKQWESRKEQSG